MLQMAFSAERRAQGCKLLLSAAVGDDACTEADACGMMGYVLQAGAIVREEHRGDRTSTVFRVPATQAVRYSFVPGLL